MEVYFRSERIVVFGFHAVLSLGSANAIRGRGHLSYSPGVCCVSEVEY